MSVRRTFQVAVVALAFGGAVAPLFSESEAQMGTGVDRTTTTTTDDRDGIDFGWIGLLGLAGLAGLMGNRRETHAMSRDAAPAR